MTATDPRGLAAQEIYNAMLNAQRDAGDAALIEALNLLAAGTGENRFRHAAGVIRGTKLGRHAIDDDWALRRIATFPAAQRREAVGIVARQVAGPDATDKQVDADAHLLRRKMRENETDKLLMSAASVP